MFPFKKRIEPWWNARTPVWLHNGTKENLLFQLALTVVVCGAMMAYHEWKDRKENPTFYEARKQRKLNSV